MEETVKHVFGLQDYRLCVFTFDPMKIGQNKICARAQCCACSELHI